MSKNKQLVKRLIKRLRRLVIKVRIGSKQCKVIFYPELKAWTYTKVEEIESIQL